MARLAPSLQRFLELPPSERRLGPFMLVEQLGRGGFAPVWLAREVYGDAELRSAAVKLFGIEGPAAARARVIDEARALCRVEHPSVVRFYALPIDEARGVMGLAMEHIAGTPLHERLARGRLPVAEALAVGAAIASALAAVHGAGLVHRDVKPANVVETGGVSKLIDFGIAAADTLDPAAPSAGPRRLEDLPEGALGKRLASLDAGAAEATAPFAVACGTVGYIDPAIVGEGEPATAASDLYALGVMLFECLTGRLPSFDPECSRLRGEVLDGRARAPSLGVATPEAPEALVRLVDSLLAPSRRDRPSSAEAVAQALEDLLTERAPPKLVEHMVPSRAPGRSGAVLAIAAALVATGGGAVYFANTLPSATPGPAWSAAPALPSTAPLRAVVTAAPAPSAAPVPQSFSITVPPGRAPQGAWLPDFTVRHEAGNENLSWDAAADRCGERGLALCTDAQWTRACSEEARIGAVESWTMSENDRVMSRRGGTGCDAHQSIGGFPLRLSGAGICCSRAVAIQSSNRNPAFVATTSRKLLEFEAALRQGGAALGATLADPVQLFTDAATTRAEAIAAVDALFARSSDFRVVLDTCDVAVDAVADTWTANCREETRQDGRTTHGQTRLVWSGKAGKLLSASAPKASAP